MPSLGTSIRRGTQSISDMAMRMYDTRTNPLNMGAITRTTGYFSETDHPELTGIYSNTLTDSQMSTLVEHARSRRIEPIRGRDGFNYYVVSTPSCDSYTEESWQWVNADAISSSTPSLPEVKREENPIMYMRGVSYIIEELAQKLDYVWTFNGSGENFFIKCHDSIEDYGVMRRFDMPGLFASKRKYITNLMEAMVEEMKDAIGE